MTQHEFTEGMARVSAMFHGCGAVYAAEVWSKLSNVHGPIWFKAVDWIINNWTDRGAPRIPTWWVAVNKSKEAAGLSTGPWRCDVCSGEQFERRDLMENDRIVTCMIPCAKCNRGAKIENSDAMKALLKTAIPVTVPPDGPSESTVRFLRQAYQVDGWTDEDWAMSPEDVMRAFMGARARGEVKSKGSSGFAAILAQAGTPARTGSVQA
jgi:hypothetical protein